MQVSAGEVQALPQSGFRLNFAPRYTAQALLSSADEIDLCL
jgi:hypothetical protein